MNGIFLLAIMWYINITNSMTCNGEGIDSVSTLCESYKLNVCVLSNTHFYCPIECNKTMKTFILVDNEWKNSSEVEMHLNSLVVKSEKPSATDWHWKIYEKKVSVVKHSIKCQNFEIRNFFVYWRAIQSCGRTLLSCLKIGLNFLLLYCMLCLNS